jgi:hypothetical protein
MKVSDIKYFLGKRLPKKYVVFAIDDYGNTRVPAKDPILNTNSTNRFDLVDTLETRTDLELLFEVLKSVTDQYGNHAVFTPFSLTHNVNVESLLDGEFAVELLPDTFKKLSNSNPENYSGAWETLNVGMEEGIFAPEFHGREHFSYDMVKKLWDEFPEFRKEVMIKKGLYDIDHWNSKYNGRWNSSFSYFNGADVGSFKNILSEGVQAFRSVYGKSPKAFTPPGQEFPTQLISYCSKLGLKAIDRPFLTVKSWDKKKSYQLNINWLGKGEEPTRIVRNIVFEPALDGYLSSISRVISDVGKAFNHKKPVIISSHRANFCGAIDERYRQKGLLNLRLLLNELLKKHPDVCFVSYAVLVELIRKNDLK